MLLTESLPPVAHLLTMSGRWRREDENHYRFITSSHGDHFYLLSRQYLHDFDSTLPLVLDAHFIRFKTVYQHQLDETRALLADGSIDCRDEDGVLHRFLAIDTLEESTHAPTMIRMLGFAITTEPVTLGNVVFELVTSSVMRDIGAPKSDLDNRYPGWQQRWAIGQDLGVEHAELMRHVFPAHSPRKCLASCISQVSFE